MKTLILLAITLAATGLIAQTEAPRLLDKRVVAFDYASMLLDAGVSSTYSYNYNCYESNPMYGGRHPTRERYFVQMTAQTTAVTALSYWLVRRGHPRWGRLGGVIDGSLHAFGAGQTLYNCR